MADESVVAISSDNDDSSPDRQPRPTNSVTSLDFYQGVGDSLSSTHFDDSHALSIAVPPASGASDVTPSENQPTPTLELQTPPPATKVPTEVEQPAAEDTPLPPGSINVILEAMKKMSQQIEQSKQEMKEELTQKIDGSKEEMKTELNRISSKLDRKVEELRVDFQKQLKEKVDSLKEDITTEKVNSKKYTDEQIHAVRNELAEAVLPQKELEAKNKQLETRLKQTNGYVAENKERLGVVEAQQETHSNQIKKLTADVTRASNNCSNSNSMEELKKQLAQTQAECNKIKNNLANFNSTGGTSNNIINSQQLLTSIPVFDNSPTGIQPRAFIQHLEAVNSMANISWQVWKMQLLIILQGEPLIYFRSKLPELQSLEDFTKNFLATFWSSAKQRALLSHIITCRYDKNHGLSMTAFVAHMKYLNSLLDLPIQSNSLIEVLTNKLPRTIQLSLSTNDFDTFDKFEVCLFRLQNIEESFETQPNFAKRTDRPSSSNPYHGNNNGSPPGTQLTADYGDNAGNSQGVYSRNNSFNKGQNDSVISVNTPVTTDNNKNKPDLANRTLPSGNETSTPSSSGNQKSSFNNGNRRNPGHYKGNGNNSHLNNTD